MGKYIDKDATIAKIKEIYNEDYKFLPSDIVESVRDFKDDLLAALDTLEVKEVNLEKELSYADYMEFFEKYPNFPDDWGYDEARIFANYFFKLGLKTQKGE